MKKFLSILLILTALGALAFSLTKKQRAASATQDLYLKTSDAAKISKTVTIAGDDWLGYAVFRSPQFAQILAQDGIGVRFEMVMDFGKRVQGLSDGTYQFATITLDSYLAQGTKLNWPGVILWTIDESNGGDAIIGVPPIQKVDDLNNASGAFTGGSPSEFLLMSQITHFQLDNLRKKMPSFATGSVEEAYKSLQTGKVQFAVLWEPFKTKALQEIPNARVIIDTTQARGLIIDIFLASRTILASDPDTVQKLSHAYFTVLHEWLNSPARMAEAALRDINARDHKKTLQDTEQMLKGIHFASHQENSEPGGWMGQSDPKLVQSVLQLSRILENQGTGVRLPNGDANAIVYKRTILETKNLPKVTGILPKISEFYTPLSQTEWSELKKKVKGTLLDTPIFFRPGQTEIPEETQEEVREAAPKLAHYPSYRIVVEAHSYGNSPDEDQQISEERAAEVKRMLMWDCNIPDERILADGKGSTEVLQRFTDENDQAYARRNRRAKILLVGE